MERRMGSAHGAKGRRKYGFRTLQEDIFNTDDWRISERAHDQLHGPNLWVYTSTPTLGTTIGTKLRPPRGGEMIRLSAIVMAAPSGDDFELDLLVNGTSVLNSEYVTILDGATTSEYRYPSNKVVFDENTYLQFQVVTVAGATGPYVVTLEYLPGW